MPTYEYACKSCGKHHEVQQSFTDDALTSCPSCGGALRKVFGNIAISFKGSGFYSTDNRSVGKAGASTGKADGDSHAPAEGASTSDSSGSKEGSSSSDSSKSESGSGSPESGSSESGSSKTGSSKTGSSKSESGSSGGDSKGGSGGSSSGEKTAAAAS